MHAHLARGQPGGCEAKVSVVEQHNGHIDRLGLEKDDESVALEVALGIRVQLDTRAAAVDLFGDDAAFSGEELGYLVDRRVGWEASDVDGSVLLWLRWPLFVPLCLFCGASITVAIAVLLLRQREKKRLSDRSVICPPPTRYLAREHFRKKLCARHVCARW